MCDLSELSHDDFSKVFFFFSCVKLIGSVQKNLYNPDHFYPIFRSNRILQILWVFYCLRQIKKSLILFYLFDKAFKTANRRLKIRLACVVH
jgi:hypothetical protein